MEIKENVKKYLENVPESKWHFTNGLLCRVLSVASRYTEYDADQLEYNFSTFGCLH